MTALSFTSSSLLSTSTLVVLELDLGHRALEVVALADLLHGLVMAFLTSSRSTLDTTSNEHSLAMGTPHPDTPFRLALCLGLGKGRDRINRMNSRINRTGACCILLDPVNPVPAFHPSSPAAPAARANPPRGSEAGRRTAPGRGGPPPGACGPAIRTRSRPRPAAPRRDPAPGLPGARNPGPGSCGSGCSGWLGSGCRSPAEPSGQRRSPVSSRSSRRAAASGILARIAAPAGDLQGGGVDTVPELLHHQQVALPREGHHVHPVGPLEAVEGMLATGMGAAPLGHDLPEEARILPHALGFLGPGRVRVEAFRVAVQEPHQYLGMDDPGGCRRRCRRPGGPAPGIPRPGGTATHRGCGCRGGNRRPRAGRGPAPPPAPPARPGG